MTDYDRIARAIEFIAGRVDRQPTLQEIADHLHLSPFHFQRLFSRWVGVTPKRFLQVLTVERAKGLLDESHSLLEVSHALGLSSGSRLYDHFVQLEAVTPGEFKARGKGLIIEYGMQETPFGPAFIATTPKGICTFAFLNEPGLNDSGMNESGSDESGVASHLADLRHQWPQAEIRENQEKTRAVVHALFAKPVPDGRQSPISLHVSGTNFQISVWKGLLRIPPATVTSYAQLAQAIGRPGAARAVGQAVGANPVALLIPCHRVIRQNGQLGGYHWGETRKQAIHVWESARHEPASEP